MIAIDMLGGTETARERGQLMSLLAQCVEGGASIGFLAPLAPAEAEAYWAKVEGDVRGGGKVLLVARDAGSGTIVGSAQLALESRPNGRHRAEVQKVMVRPAARRQGIATQLMAAIEAVARERRVTLLFLDTSDSHAGARPLYEALKYVYVGGIPGYALDPHGTSEANAILLQDARARRLNRFTGERREPARATGDVRDVRAAGRRASYATDAGGDGGAAAAARRNRL